ncbi:MAG: hypothetical protein RIQ71_842 [Verrucomicrobiota bacterium]|jgi:hypothetical protein
MNNYIDLLFLILSAVAFICTGLLLAELRQMTK